MITERIRKFFTCLITLPAATNEPFVTTILITHGEFPRYNVSEHLCMYTRHRAASSHHYWFNNATAPTSGGYYSSNSLPNWPSPLYAKI